MSLRPHLQAGEFIVTAEVGIAIAQTTIVIATCRLAPSRCKSPGINGSAILGPGTSRINVVTACLRCSR